MNYMGNSTWWNERFRNRELRIMQNEKYLEEDVAKIFPKEGKVLDIACGDGRNSIYLSKLGYDVKAIDFSSEALNRLNYFAQKEGLYIKTECVDLSNINIFDNNDKYDVIIINHYRLEPRLYSELENILNIGGILWINGFREIPQDNLNIKENDIIIEKDFEGLNNCRLCDKLTYEIGDRKFIKYIWIREN